MATAAIAGHVATLEVSPDGGSNYYAIGELRDWEIRVEVNAIDATSRDSAGWGEEIDGIKRWRGNANAMYLDANTAQDAIWTALTGGTTLKGRFRPKVASGFDQYVGDFRIRNWAPAAPLEDAVAVDIEFTGTGSLVKSNQ